MVYQNWLNIPNCDFSSSVFEPLHVMVSKMGSKMVKEFFGLNCMLK